MELLFILLFAANLFELTEAKHINHFEDEEYSQEYNEEYDTDYNKEYEEEDDLFELPPDPNPVSGFAEGPLPKFIELNLQVKYDLTLLEWFGGSKEATENYVQSVIHLAKLHLKHSNLDIKIHTKVVLILLLITSICCNSFNPFFQTNQYIFVCLSCFLFVYLFNLICHLLFIVFSDCQYGACCNQSPTKWKGGQDLDEKALEVRTSPASLLLFRQDKD